MGQLLQDGLGPNLKSLEALAATERRHTERCLAASDGLPFSAQRGGDLLLALASSPTVKPTPSRLQAGVWWQGKGLGARGLWGTIGRQISRAGASAIRGGSMNAPKTISVMPDAVSHEIFSIYDEVLADWSVPAAEIMVHTRYGVTHVIEAGPKDGPVVVLLHGMGFPAPIMWSTLAPQLGVSYRLIAPDTIGDVGKSLLDGETKAPRSGADYSHWLGDVLEGVGIGDGKVAIVGTSYGAWLALHHCL